MTVVNDGLTGLGILADALAVGAGLIALWKGVPKLAAWLSQRNIPSVLRYVETLNRQFPAAKETLRNSRIAIVDDEPNSFPVDHLRAICGQVDVFQSISLANVDTLKAFDILFLDIAGVVPEDLRNGGIEILKRLRVGGREEPLIIAVSSKSFKLEINRFFSLADDVLDKPLKPALTEEALLDLILEKRTVEGLSPPKRPFSPGKGRQVQLAGNRGQSRLSPALLKSGNASALRRVTFFAGTKKVTKESALSPIRANSPVRFFSTIFRLAIHGSTEDGAHPVHRPEGVQRNPLLIHLR